MLSNLDIPFNFFIKNSVDSRWFFKNIARNKVSKVLLSRSYDNSTQKSVWNLIQSTKCKLKKKNLKTFINLFIFFLKQTRSTNKIHLWERLFKFDFLLFFFTRNKKQNPIHFYQNWALIKRGRVNDPFEKWRVTTSQW